MYTAVYWGHSTTETQTVRAASVTGTTGTKDANLIVGSHQTWYAFPGMFGIRVHELPGAPRTSKLLVFSDLKTETPPGMRIILLMLMNRFMRGAVLYVSNGRADHQKEHGIITDTSTGRQDQRLRKSGRYTITSMLIERRADHH